MEKYNKEEDFMKTFYQSLDEASKRRYAALESKKLGHGGKYQNGIILLWHSHKITNLFRT